jgi:ABC-2 type transport system permease protein
VTAPLTVRPDARPVDPPPSRSGTATFATLVRHEIRRATRSWLPRLLFMVIPLWLAWFVKPAFAYALTTVGESAGPAAAQALAGQVVMFGSISLIFLGHAIFEDRDTHSDDRLVAVGVRRWELLDSKLVVTLGHQVVLTTFVLLLGSLVLGADAPGDVLAWISLSLAWCLAATGIGLVMVGLSRTAAGFTLLCYGGSLVLVAGAGGLAPYSLLPDWARTIARVFPSYWYLRGMDDVFVRRLTFARVVPDVLALVACAAGALVVGAVLLRVRGGNRQVGT